MQPPDSISVVVSTYNDPARLELVLRSLDRQIDRRFEVVVADDGSGCATREMIEAVRSDVRFPLIHAWQPDSGFRLARSRNVGAINASGSALVFLDGDCLVRPGFIAEVRRSLRPGWFVGGRRIMLPAQLSASIEASSRMLRAVTGHGLILRGLLGGVPKLRMAYHVRNRRPPRVDLAAEGFAGFLFAVFRSDFEHVDGFDLRYEGWGDEDADLFARLSHLGVKSGLLGASATVLHLWHDETSRSAWSKNRALLQDTIRDRRVQAVEGLSCMRPGEDYTHAVIADSGQV